MKGLHIIADLYNCAKSDFLVSSDKLRDLCVKACTDSGLTVLGQHFYQFDGVNGTQDGGSTGAVVLAESHLAIHTWPEFGFVTIDVYVCNLLTDNKAKAERLFRSLEAALKPLRTKFHAIERGGKDD